MTVTVPTNWMANDSTGWHSFTQDGGGSLVCVSSSGSDSTGTGTMANPYKTIAHASAPGQFASLTGGKDHWLLLKKGDIFPNDSFYGTNFNGGSTLQADGITPKWPVLVSSYDPAYIDGGGNPIPDPIGSSLARPIVCADPTASVLISSNGGLAIPNGNYWAFVGIEFYGSQRDPNNTSGSKTPLYDVTKINDGSTNGAISMAEPFNWFLIENCKFSFFWTPVVIGTSTTYSNAIFRRNIVVDSYGAYWGVGRAPNTHNQGPLIVLVVGLTMEGNIFDANGWSKYLAAPASVSVVSSGGRALVTWAGNPMPTTAQGGDGCSIIFNTASADGSIHTGSCNNRSFTTGTIYYVFNNNGTTFNISTTDVTPTYVNLSGTLSSQACWIDCIGDQFCHNFYIQDIGRYYVVRGNIVANEITGTNIRQASQVYDNIWIRMRNSHGMSGNDAGYAGTVNNNVYIEAGGPSIMGAVTYGASLGTLPNYDQSLLNATGYDVFNNIFCHSLATGYDVIGLACGMNNIKMHSNIFYDMQSTGVLSGGYQEADFYPSGNYLSNGSIATYHVTAAGSNGTFTQAVLSGSATGDHALITYTVSSGVVTSSHIDAPNFSPGAGDINLGGVAYTVSDTLTTPSGLTIVVDTVNGGNTFDGTNQIYLPAGNYPDPTRSVGSYAGTKGLTATTDGFLDAARGQSKQAWSLDYTANSVNNYIRAGFGLAAYPGPAGGGTMAAPLVGQTIIVSPSKHRGRKW